MHTVNGAYFFVNGCMAKQDENQLSEISDMRFGYSAAFEVESNQRVKEELSVYCSKNGDNWFCFYFMNNHQSFKSG